VFSNSAVALLCPTWRHVAGTAARGRRAQRVRPLAALTSIYKVRTARGQLLADEASRNSPVHACDACAPSPCIVFATQSSVSSAFSAFHHHFPFAASHRSNPSHFDSAITSIMRLVNGFTSRALARTVIILIEIGRHNYATRKDKRSHSDARQAIFHRSSLLRSLSA
jgi:hypothetical protein